MRVLERVVERAKSAGDTDIVVTTAETSPNDAIAEWCRREGVRCFRGEESDLLGRHRAVAAETGVDRLVRITGDCPFVPPSEIDRLLAEQAESDARYVTNVIETMPIGVGVDVIDVALLDELAALGETHPVLRLRENPEEWGTAFSPNPDWESYADAHVAVDTPSDYWTLTDAVAAVGDDSKAVTEWVAADRATDTA
jgi:spore coat polysaccharide biosynthesis protein SpsF